MICPNLWGTKSFLIGTLGDPCGGTVFVGTLGDPCWMTVFAGTLGGVVWVWKISVNSCIILFVASSFRNGVRSCGCLIADDISSNATTIQSSEDFFGMLYLVGRNLIVSEIRCPPVSANDTSKCQ